MTGLGGTPTSSLAEPKTQSGLHFALLATSCTPFSAYKYSNYLYSIIESLYVFAIKRLTEQDLWGNNCCA